MKAYIEKSLKNSLATPTQIWRLVYYRPSNNGLKACTELFPFFEGAQQRFLKLEAQIIREQKAYSKLRLINTRLLSLREYEFIQGLYKIKCIDITKRQYGYLTGILERQQ
jgi:hypothetical protein